jgi:hypothetical protein
MSTKTTNYDLTKPGIDEAYDIAILNANMDTIDAHLYEEVKELTMSASGWTALSKSYDFSSLYASDKYNISVGPSSNMTDDQFKAWAKLKPMDNPTANILIIKGTVPTIDIPIVLKARLK